MLEQARKTGLVARGDGETSVKYAVFRRDLLEATVGALSDDGAAEEATGWSSFYRGPGRAFGDPPCIRVFGKNVLITQRVGLDI